MQIRVLKSVGALCPQKKLALYFVFFYHMIVLQKVTVRKKGVDWGII